MHIEILVEDSSGEKLIRSLLPKFGDFQDGKSTCRVHSYRGVGKLPNNLTKADPARRMLLDQLPRLIIGYGRTPGIDAVIVILDSDTRDVEVFSRDLNALHQRCNPVPKRFAFELAVEEVEAWYFGDRAALLQAYPRAKKLILDRYEQDSICGTWELLADAIYPGGSAAVKKAGWPLPGQIKHEWAERIGPHLDLDRNLSPSFCRLIQKLRAFLRE